MNRSASLVRYSILSIRERMPGLAPYELRYTTATGRLAVANPSPKQLDPRLIEAGPGEIPVEFELAPTGQPIHIQPASQHSILLIRENSKGLAPYELRYTTATGKAAVANPGLPQLDPSLIGVGPGEIQVEFGLDLTGQPTCIRPVAVTPETAGARSGGVGVRSATQPSPTPNAPAETPLATPPVEERAFEADTIILLDTARQLANLIPLVALGAVRAQLVQTAQARERGWVEQLRAAVRPGVRLEVIAVEDQEAFLPRVVCRRVLGALDAVATPGRVAFVWGGEQQPASAGMWEAFVAWHGRAPEGGHLAVYADQHRERLLAWTAPEELVEAPLRCSLSFEQVIRAAGFERSSVPAPPDIDSAILENAERIFSTQKEYRRFCFEWAGRLAQTGAYDLSIVEQRLLVQEGFERVVTPSAMKLLVSEALKDTSSTGYDAKERGWLSQNLSPWLYKKLGEQLRRGSVEPAPVALPTDPKTLRWLEAANPGGLKAAMARGWLNLGLPGCERFGVLFERLLRARLERWASTRRGQIADMVFNVTVRRPGSGQQAGEFDAAIVTRSGRLVVLDAKTFDEDTHKRRAQTRIVEQVGGSWALRYAVVPAFAPDRGTPDPSTPLDTWGCAPWYPRHLAALLGRAQDTNLPPDERPKVLRFDETDALELELDRCCGITGRA